MDIEYHQDKQTQISISIANQFSLFTFISLYSFSSIFSPPFSPSALYLSPPLLGSLPNPSRSVVGDTIIFHSVQIGSSAVYQCNASNHHGYLLANAFVSILGKERELCWW